MTNLHDEVVTLKRRVGTLEERQELEAGLAASRDRDLSDLGVKIKQLQPMLQGLQERLADEAETFKQHATRFDAVDSVLDQHTARLVALEQGQIELKQGQVELRNDLNGGLAELRGGLAGLRTDLNGGLTELRGGLAELRTDLNGGLTELREDLKGGLAEVKGGQTALIELLTKMFDRPKTAE
jgi:chromosome segregation ATPase